MRAVFGIVLLLCCLADLSQAWRCSPVRGLSRVQQIDAGMGSVVATASNRPYFLSGSSWYRLGTYAIQHMTVGPSGMWGTYGNRLYKYVGGNFQYAKRTDIRKVDAGSTGPLVAVSSRNHAYCLRQGFAQPYTGRNGIGGWTALRAHIKYFSCGKFGCWGVDLWNYVYFTRTMNSLCRGSGWTRVSTNRMVMVEAATDGKVFGIWGNQVYERLGISSGRPSGTTWRQVSLCLKAKHASYDLGQLWLVTTAGTVTKCTR